MLHMDYIYCVYEFVFYYSLAFQLVYLLLLLVPSVYLHWQK